MEREAREAETDACAGKTMRVQEEHSAKRGEQHAPSHAQREAPTQAQQTRDADGMLHEEGEDGAKDRAAPYTLGSRKAPLAPVLHKATPILPQRLLAITVSKMYTCYCTL